MSASALRVAAAIVLAVTATACRKSRSETAVEETPPEENGTGPAEGADQKKLPSAPPPGPTGTITGTVKLSGTPPEMPVLQRGSDGFCAKKEMRAETVLVGDGGLQNALARIEPGAVPGWVPSEPVVVDQVDCMYRPRVQGGVRGQMLEVKNSDQTMHNVNARRLPWGERRDVDSIFNRGQTAGAPPIKDSISDADIVKLKCDVHGWMQGYVVVSDNPYFATSDEQGRFTIEKAPVGSYSVQIWHEYYGIKTEKVTVKEGATATVEVTYDAEKDRPAKTGSP
jgi:Carboxypeptidase regulatory-like domain